MSIVLQGSTSGSCTLQEQAVAGTTVLTLPTTSGTVLTSASSITQNSGPAFSAYKSSQQNFSSSTWTKITLDLEVFDTNNNFASSTFTPTVAGYYQINAGVALSNLTDYMTSGVTGIYKNGALYQRGLANCGGGGSKFNDVLFVTSGIIYMNGTTDYLELYAYEVAGGTPAAVGNSDTYQTFFNGALIRGA